MSYQRSDRRTRASSDWGKPDLSYPHGSALWPQILETDTVSQTKQLPAALSSHPNTTLYPNAKLVEMETDAGGNRDCDWWLTYKTLPGPVVTRETILGNNGIPILVSEQEIASNVLYTPGEFLPAASSVASIATGNAPLVTFAAAHGLPVGAWVRFSGTNSTPALGSQTSGALTIGATYYITSYSSSDDFTNVGASANATGITFTATGTTAAVYSHGSTLSRLLQITSAPSDTSITVAAPATITNAGTAAGTMQSQHRISRQIEKTGNDNIKMKVESMIGCPDVGVFNTDVAGKTNYPFPEYCRSYKFHEDASVTVIGTARSGTPSANNSWSGGVGLDLQPGYRGPCDARLQEFYFSAQPPDSFNAAYSPTIIIPSAGTFVIQGGTCDTVGFPTLYEQITVSNSFRTGTIPAIITGPSPALITVPSNAGSLAVSAITTGDSSGTPNYPLVTTVLDHGLSAGMTVIFSDMDCTPQITGPYEVIDVGTGGPNTFHINATVSGSGSSGSVRLFSTAAFGSGTATCNLSLTESFPPKIIGKLGIESISTGATPTILLTSAHYWQPGQRVKLVGTTCTPPIPDGFYRIVSVGSDTFTVTPPQPVTIAQGGPAGSARGVITLLKEAEKIGPGLWRVPVDLIEIPYTSGDNPA